MPGPQSTAQSLYGFSEALADVVERVGARVVALHARRSYPSSGLIWRDGVLLTAAHTIRRESGIAALLPDGSAASATLVGIDAGTDIAALRVDTHTGDVAPPGDAAAVRPGHYVVAAARGADGDVVASSGIVARTGGEWRTWRGGRIDRLIQLDGGLWPGFSGAPVVDVNGSLLGIATSALTRGRAVVIPTSLLRRTGEELIAHGTVSRTFLGIGAQAAEIPQRLRESLGLDTHRGLVVLSIASDGPADAAGVMLGDVIVSVDEKPVHDVDVLRNLIAEKPVGSHVTLKLVRASQLLSVQVKLGARAHAG